MKKTLLAVIVLFAQYSYGQTSATEKNIEQIILKARKKVNQERNEFTKKGVNPEEKISPSLPKGHYIVKVEKEGEYIFSSKLIVR